MKEWKINKMKRLTAFKAETVKTEVLHRMKPEIRTEQTDLVMKFKSIGKDEIEAIIKMAEKHNLLFFIGDDGMVLVF